MDDTMSNLRTLRAITLLTSVVWLGACEFAPPSRLVQGPPTRLPFDAIGLDGHFDDWTGAPTLISLDAPSPLASVQVLDAPASLALRLVFRDSVNLQAMPGTLHLLVSSPRGGGKTRGTGSAYGVRNVEFAIDFSRLDKAQNGRGAGFALREATRKGLGAFRSPYELDITALPTWSSDQFEVRIARRAEGQFGHIAPLSAITAVYVSADSVVHKSATVQYRSGTPILNVERPRADEIPAPRAGTLRIAQWNVSEGSFRTPAMHARLLAALAPDVLMLDEVYEQVTPDSLRAFFNLPPLRELGPWQFVIAGSGGRQRTVVAARRRTVRPEPSMARMRYEAGALDSLKRLVPAAAHRLIDIEEQAQISSTGAWVNADGRDVLFVPLDLQSGGYAGSVQDALRVLQARAIRQYVRQVVDTYREAHGGAVPPIVLGGDFNPVGSFESVRILGPALLDDVVQDLRPTLAQRLNQHSAVTWASEAAAQFAPGQLDLTFVRGLRRVGGFVFTTEDLSDTVLSRLDMTRDSFARVSDHFIVVTDLTR
jgi:hypothetical protein